MAHKLFISYRSTDSPQVDKIVRDLRMLPDEHGLPRYETWQDKQNLPPASPHWWDAIVDAIIGCDIFVFHVSRASLESHVCMAELTYAHKRNRPIIPVVLNGEFKLNPITAKYDIDYWDLIPDWMRDIQFLFYIGADFYKTFQAAVDALEGNWPRDIESKRPLNPDSNSVHGSNHEVYDAACDYADRLAFDDAEKHFRILLHRKDPDYMDVAADWLEILDLYSELITLNNSRRAKFMFDRKWKAYQDLFPKSFMPGIFDPYNFRSNNIVAGIASEVPTATVTPLALDPPQPDIAQKLESVDEVDEVYAIRAKWLDTQQILSPDEAKVAIFDVLNIIQIGNYQLAVDICDAVMAWLPSHMQGQLTQIRADAQILLDEILLAEAIKDEYDIIQMKLNSGHQGIIENGINDLNRFFKDYPDFGDPERLHLIAVKELNGMGREEEAYQFRRWFYDYRERYRVIDYAYIEHYGPYTRVRYKKKLLPDGKHKWERIPEEFFGYYTIVAVEKEPFMSYMRVYGIGWTQL